METIGALLVRLLFDDSQFESESKSAEQDFQRVGAQFEATAERVNQSIARSFQIGAAALTAFVGASAVVGAGFQQQIDIIGAISGATEEQLGQLEERARELGATTRFTATEAAQGLTALAQAGASVAEAIEVSGTALNAATANRVGLEEATQSLIAVQRQFATQQVTSAQASDILTRATQVSLLNFTELTTALRFGGVTAASFGISLEETATGLAAFRDLGLEASQAGTVLRGTLVGATQESAKNAETLREVGLTFEDINPEVNGFIGLVENLAGSAAETDDILSLFGQRAGPAIANLVANIRSGAVDLRALNATIADSAGTTADTVEAVSDNVATQLAILRSAIEDVFLETFGAIAGPLQDGLEQLQSFFNEVAESIGNVSNVIEDNLTRAAEQFGSAIGESGNSIADTFANILVLASQFVLAVTPIVNLFLRLVPLADDLAFAIGTAFVAGRAAAFARALVALPGLISAATAAMTAFGTATTVSTGGLSALAAAVAVVVTGLAVYINTLGKAQAATESLAEAQAAAAATSQAQADAIASRLEPLLRRQQDRARELLETSTDLSDAREAELREILRLTAAEAAAAVATGRLIETNNGLRTVQSLVEEGGRDQAESLRLLAEDAQRTERELGRLTERARGQIEAFDAGRINGALAAATLREFAGAAEDALPAEVITLARQRLIELTNEQQAAAARVTNINQQVTDALRVNLVRTAENAEATTDIVQTATDQQVEALTSALDEIERIRQGAVDAGAGLFLSDPQQVQRDLQIQLAALEAAFAQVVANTQAGSAERLAAEAAFLDARAQLRANANAELAEQEQQAADEQLDAANARLQAVLSVEADSVNELVNIERDGQAALRELEAAGADERAAIAEQFAARIAQVEDPNERIALVRERNAALEGLDQELGDQRVAIEEATNVRLADERDRQRAEEAARNQEFIDAIRAEAGPLERLFDNTVDSILLGLNRLLPGLARGVTDAVSLISASVDEVLNLFGAVTGGFGLDIAGTFQDIAAAQEDAADALVDAREALAEAQAGGDPAEIAAAQEALDEARAERQRASSEEAAREFIESSAQAAIAFVENVAQNIGPILDQFAESLSAVVASVVENVGPIVQSIVEALPGLITQLGQAAVGLLGAVVEGVQVLLSGLDEIITSLFGALNELVANLGETVSGILTGITDNLDTILVALAEGLVDLVVTLAGEIPEIITAVVEAVPDIILAVVNAVPDIITAVVEAIPEIILAIVGALPDLITALVLLVPEVITGVIDALPRLITALIDGIVGPEGLVARIPEIAVAIGEAILQAIGNIFESLVGIFGDLIAQILGPVADLLGIGGEGGGLFGGASPGGLFEGDGIFRGGGFFDQLEAATTGAVGNVIDGILGGIGSLFGGGAQGGIPFVQRTTGTLVHAGEGILTAQENRQRLFGAATDGRLNPIGPAGAANFPAGRGGGSTTIVIDIGGKTWDRFNVEADRQGNRGLSNKDARRKTGTRVAFRRPSQTGK